MSTVSGVEGEERSDYTKAESRQIRKRSLRLLGSLVRPMRGRMVLIMLVVVVSTALQVLGPALIAYGIDTGLPAILEQTGLVPARVRGSRPTSPRASAARCSSRGTPCSRHGSARPC